MDKSTTLILALLFAACFGEPITADEKMPLDEITAGLAKHPPQLGDNSARGPYIEALDAWAAARDTIYRDKNPETANAEFYRYYLRSMKTALLEASKTQVDSGAVVWKLYSSGFLVKTPTATFAIDVVEGPYKNIKGSPDDEPGYVFKWAEPMRQKFAETVDVLCVTHWHYDHTSYALTQDLIEAGKTVVVPQQLKDSWRNESFANELTVLEPDVDHSIAGPTIRVHNGVQYMVTDKDGKWISSPKYDAENIVYLIRSGEGPGFHHHGDNRGTSYGGWMRKAIKDGWTVDIWLTKTVIPEIAEMIHPIIVPSHEYEMGHKPRHGIGRLTPWHKSFMKDRYAEGKGLLLTWGEHFHFD